MTTVDLIDDSELVPVKNMMRNEVGYTLSNGVSRHFAPHMTIRIKASELRDLSYESGGLDFLRNYVCVGNADLAEEFGISNDLIEYTWTEQDVVNALTTSDLDVLLDALDFAPDGILDELRDKAVELEIADGNRIAAINKRMGVDINNMIKNKHAYDTVDTKSEEAPKQRRSSTAKKTTTTRRRTTAAKETVEDTSAEEKVAAPKKTAAKKSTVKKTTTAKEQETTEE